MDARDRLLNPAIELLPPVFRHDLPDALLPGIDACLLTLGNPQAEGAGNKFYKLLLNIQAAKQQGYAGILSFGGAFSNHIHALAEVCRQQELQSIGIIRGEPQYAGNPTLSFAQEQGMQLRFVDRKTYRLRHDPGYLEQLQQQYPGMYLLPEGGSNVLAVEGCALLARQIDERVSADAAVAVACGTGGTLAGLGAGFAGRREVLGFAVVNDAGLEKRIHALLDGYGYSGQRSFRLYPADFGGYARVDADYTGFIGSWMEQGGVLPDPVYTGKMFRKLQRLAEAGALDSATPLALLHTGGLQGWSGMLERISDQDRDRLASFFDV